MSDLVKPWYQAGEGITAEVQQPDGSTVPFRSVPKGPATYSVVIVADYYSEQSIIANVTLDEALYVVRMLAPPGVAIAGIRWTHTIAVRKHQAWEWERAD